MSPASNSSSQHPLPTTTTTTTAVRKKRSFSLPSFRKPATPTPSIPPSTAQQPMIDEHIARARKAAAWQWYTRGLGDVVTPTKHPSQQQSPPPLHRPINTAAVPIIATSPRQNQQTPAAARMPLPRSPSRFKAEAAGARSFSSTSSAPAPPPGSPSIPAPSPLFDEFELSGLRSHMADLVHRLHQKQDAPEAAVTDKKLSSAAPTPRPAAAPNFTPIHGVHPTPPSAIHRFFHKVNFIGSLLKSSKKSSHAPYVLVTPDEAPKVLDVTPTEAPLDNEVNDQEDVQYHYHHYIHHHHHHYHYGRSPDEVGAAVVGSRHRRHSESTEALRPHISSLWEAEEDEYDDQVDSPIKTFLDVRGRRHSEDFSHGYAQRKAQYSNEQVDESAMKSALHGQLQRMHSSARFATPNKIHGPGHGNRMSKAGEGDKVKEGSFKGQSGKSFQESIHYIEMEEEKQIPNGRGLYDSTPRTRRHSAEIVRESSHSKLAMYPAMSQRVTAQAPRRRHSETYDASYRASVREYESDGGYHKATRTPSPKISHNYCGRDMGSRSERRPLRQFKDVFITTNVPHHPPLYPK